jgi:transcriptional regulator with XRE-family HTH domain
MLPHPQDLARYRIQDLLDQAEHARLVSRLRSLRRIRRRAARQAAAGPAPSNQAVAAVTVPWPAHPDQGRDMLGARIRSERDRRGLSLGALAERSGVRRSMLHQVEHGQTAPTVLVLDRIATGLGTSIARLVSGERTGRVVLLPREGQRVVHDPSGWERRILSPVLPSVEFELMRTRIGPGVAPGFFDPHPPGSREYLAVEQGELELTLDGERYRLGPGDAIYYAGDGHHGFANRGAIDCVYYLAMDLTGRP